MSFDGGEWGRGLGLSQERIPAGTTRTIQGPVYAFRVVQGGPGCFVRCDNQGEAVELLALAAYRCPVRKDSAIASMRTRQPWKNLQFTAAGIASLAQRVAGAGSPIGSGDLVVEFTTDDVTDLSDPSDPSFGVSVPFVDGEISAGRWTALAAGTAYAVMPDCTLIPFGINILQSGWAALQAAQPSIGIGRGLYRAPRGARGVNVFTNLPGGFTGGPGTLQLIAGIDPPDLFPNSPFAAGNPGTLTPFSVAQTRFDQYPLMNYTYGADAGGAGAVISRLVIPVIAVTALVTVGSTARLRMEWVP